LIDQTAPVHLRGNNATRAFSAATRRSVSAIKILVDNPARLYEF
jgi:hypothetical protein